MSANYLARRRTPHVHAGSSSTATEKNTVKQYCSFARTGVWPREEHGQTVLLLRQNGVLTQRKSSDAGREQIQLLYLQPWMNIRGPFPTSSFCANRNRDPEGDDGDVEGGDAEEGAEGEMLSNIESQWVVSEQCRLRIQFLFAGWLKFRTGFTEHVTEADKPVEETPYPVELTGQRNLSSEGSGKAGGYFTEYNLTWKGLWESLPTTNVHRIRNSRICRSIPPKWGVMFPMKVKLWMSFLQQWELKMRPGTSVELVSINWRFVVLILYQLTPPWMIYSRGLLRIPTSGKNLICSWLLTRTMTKSFKN